MTESEQHSMLVRALVRWIAETYLDGDNRLILVDEASFAAGTKPLAVGGFVPDAYAHRLSDGLIVIGEAETARGITVPHTAQQLGAFLTHCSQRDRAVLVLAVPWYMTRFTKAFLRMLKNQCSARYATTVVLEELEG